MYNRHVGIFIINNCSVNISPQFLFRHTFTLEEIEEEINRLQAFAKSNKFKISGNILIGSYKDGKIFYSNWKILNKKINKLETDIKIVAGGVKKERKSPTTVEELILNVKEFAKENKRLPKIGETYKGIKVGNFVDKLSNQNSIYTELLKSVS